MNFEVPPHGTPGISGASWIRASGGDLQHPVFVRLGRGPDDDALVATGLLIEASEGELTTRATRIPLAQIVADFVAAASKPSTYKRLRREQLRIEGESEREAAWQPEGGPQPEGAPAWLPAADFLSVEDRAHVTRRVRPGRAGHPDEHYRHIAQAYRRAKRQQPRSPIRALMAELHASEPTVHRWVKEARRRGYLKGEQQ